LGEDLTAQLCQLLAHIRLSVAHLDPALFEHFGEFHKILGQLKVGEEDGKIINLPHMADLNPERPRIFKKDQSEIN
jgi:hypothetical protein